MVPRLAFDIAWRDLLRAMGYCGGLGGDDRLPLNDPSAKEAIVTLSVRSAFDLLLSALDLPAGSEVLLSEVTVPHMERIVREHQLVPVAVPVDPQTLCVAAADVEARLTDRSRLLIVAHLFGTRMPLEELGKLCYRQDLVLVEDCAQALTSGQPTRDASADVSLFSFGPIKRATALGGGIALVESNLLRARMEQLANAWPRQSTSSYLSRVLKIALLKLLSQPAIFGLLVWILVRLGVDADAFVGHSARGFPDAQLMKQLRQQPCPALRKLIAHRLRKFNSQAIGKRTAEGNQLAAALPSGVQLAGGANSTHTYWVFPLICVDPSRMVSTLRANGLDASQISGLSVLGDHADDHWFGHVVFMPLGCRPRGDKIPWIIEQGSI